MNSQQAHTLGQQFSTLLNNLEQDRAGALEAIVALFSPEAQLTNAALKRVNQSREGHEQIQAFWTEYRATFNEVQTEFHEVTSNEQAAGLFWTTRGTDTHGEPIAYDGTSLLVFDADGKITRFHGYYDTRELSRRVAA